jgi:tRNA 2-thiouridine synthesizing protein A
VSVQKHLDLTGLKCPLPVLKTRKCLSELETGDVIEVISTDPMASLDIPHFCNEQSHILLEMDKREDESYRFVIKKG